MSQIQVVAQYPEYGFAVLEDDDGQFLYTDAREDLIPLRTKTKVDPRTLIARFVKNRSESMSLAV